MRPIRSGVSASLVVNPYSADREVLKTVTIVKSVPIYLDASAKIIFFKGAPLTKEGNEVFAKNEGFDTVDDFWFYIENHKFSKKNCYLIMWKDFDYTQYHRN